MHEEHNIAGTGTAGLRVGIGISIGIYEPQDGQEKRTERL